MARSAQLSPKLSIGLPVDNRERFPLPALECLAQTFGDFEIIVGDDVSTDHTQQICPRGSD
jgi:glycosyltransferase involved in cell wall biosynthesis